MKKKDHPVSSVAGPQPDSLERHQVRLGNLYVRHTIAARRKAIRALERFIYGKTSTTSYWNRWSEDEMLVCYRQLLSISEEMANSWRRFAFELLKTGLNDRLSVKVLMDYLYCRNLIEESKPTPTNRSGGRPAINNKIGLALPLTLTGTTGDAD